MSIIKGPAYCLMLVAAVGFTDAILPCRSANLLWLQCPLTCGRAKTGLEPAAPGLLPLAGLHPTALSLKGRPSPAALGPLLNP